MRTGSRALAIFAVAFGLLVGLPNVAGAQVYTGVNPPTVGGADVAVLGAQGVGVLVQPAAGAQLASGGQLTAGGQVPVLGAGGAQLVQQLARVGGLAVTGEDIIGLVGLALAAIAIGSVAVRFGRRADASS